MVRILVLKDLNNLSDEAMERLLLDRASYKRLCQLANSSRIPDRGSNDNLVVCGSYW